MSHVFPCPWFLVYKNSVMAAAATAALCTSRCRGETRPIPQMERLSRSNDIVRSKVTIASWPFTAAAIVNCQDSSIVSISALRGHNHSHGRWRAGLQFDIRALLACWLIQTFNSRHGSTFIFDLRVQRLWQDPAMHTIKTRPAAAANRPC